MWEGVLAEYDILDRGGLAAEAIDTVERLASQNDVDGEVIQTKAGPKAALRLIRHYEANSPAGVSLPGPWNDSGLNLEAIKPMRRPPRTNAY